MLRHLTKDISIRRIDSQGLLDVEEESKKKYDEQQYLNLIRDILSYGTYEVGRNGKTKMIFGAGMHFDLRDNKIPILTTKKVAWKTCLRELLWFISGKTDNRILQEQGVKIWNGNGSREFLDSQGLKGNREGDLGPVYGHQWRHYNAKYEGCDKDYMDEGVDQLGEIIELLKNKDSRTSRRLVLSAWNPCQISEMALPPCHVICQFNVKEGNKLSCSLYQRSGDVGLGVPFNIASYSFLTHLIAKHCDLIAEEFIHFIGNAHIYDDHLEVLEEQIRKIPKEGPTINIKIKRDKIDDYVLEDFELLNYNPESQLKMEMRN